MAVTQDDVDALERALLTNQAEVTFADGSRVRFHSTDELLTRLNLARRILNAQKDVTQTTLARYRKGVQF